MALHSICGTTYSIYHITDVDLLQGTYSSHGVELVMVTVEDYKMTGTKITVCQQKYSV